MVTAIVPVGPALVHYLPISRSSTGSHGKCSYKVTISKRREVTRPKRATPPPPDELFPGAGAVGGPLALPPETIAPRYSDLSQTILTVTVPAEGEVAFDLTSP